MLQIKHSSTAIKLDVVFVRVLICVCQVKIKAEKSAFHPFTTSFTQFFIVIYWSHVDLTKIYGGTGVCSVLLRTLHICFGETVHMQNLQSPDPPTPLPSSQKHFWTRTALPPPHQPQALPLPSLPVYLSLSFSLFFSCFLSVLWRQLAWRMPGLKQHITLWSGWHCPLSLCAA